MHAYAQTQMQSILHSGSKQFTEVKYRRLKSDVFRMKGFYPHTGMERSPVQVLPTFSVRISSSNQEQSRCVKTNTFKGIRCAGVFLWYRRVSAGDDPAELECSTAPLCRAATVQMSPSKQQPTALHARTHAAAAQPPEPAAAAVLMTFRTGSCRERSRQASDTQRERRAHSGASMEGRGEGPTAFRAS
ncbi:hypothetical protein FQA47_019462 [Oryzias melastigma]|uniref:Uncharacterized protein n=1 Tax=Oryzias melastigma TaxID=30732 RepID=A0A834F796_ORYME|nr:hypothetical protein FQA47_019462 [Oryzias melastigma]